MADGEALYHYLGEQGISIRLYGRAGAHHLRHPPGENQAVLTKMADYFAAVPAKGGVTYGTLRIHAPKDQRDGSHPGALPGRGRAGHLHGVGFFDHMLSAFAVHGNFGLKVKTVGDWEVDCHHTIEDTGIVLGKAFAEALPTKRGIRRFGHAYIPMDEALAFAAADISGRPFLVFSGSSPRSGWGTTTPA